MTLIIGHRGAPQRAPENTLESFRLAFEEGADGIETDFRLTRDAQIVCIHDDSTGRTADADLRVEDATLEELRRLDVGGWKGPQWKGERMPTLREVLLSLPTGKRCFIELKSGMEILGPLAATLEESSVAADRIRILSFSADLIRAVKERLPGYRACWLTDYRWRGGWSPTPEEVMATLRRSNADGLASRNRGALDAALVAALRKEQVEIHVWTVDDAAGARRFWTLGVDSIMTNRSGWLRRMVEKEEPDVLPVSSEERQQS